MLTAQVITEYLICVFYLFNAEEKLEQERQEFFRALRELDKASSKPEPIECVVNP